MEKQSEDDNITDYLKQIYHNPTDELSKINCTEGDGNITIGKRQLCHYLSQKLIYLEENKLFRPPDDWGVLETRKDISYLDRGYFGLVFIRKLGREKLAIKVMNIYEEENQFANEVLNQKLASKISPKVYDYFLCHCNDKTYGIIVMEFLEGYMTDYKFKNILDERYQWYLSNPMFMSVFRGELEKLRYNINKTIDYLVLNCGLDIADFQTMIHPDSLEVKIIDFGLAKKIPDSEKEIVKKQLKSNLDYLFRF